MNGSINWCPAMELNHRLPVIGWRSYRWTSRAKMEQPEPTDPRSIRPPCGACNSAVDSTSTLLIASQTSPDRCGCRTRPIKNPREAFAFRGSRALRPTSRSPVPAFDSWSPEAGVWVPSRSPGYRTNDSGAMIWPRYIRLGVLVMSSLRWLQELESDQP